MEAGPNPQNPRPWPYPPTLPHPMACPRRLPSLPPRCHPDRNGKADIAATKMATDQIAAAADTASQTLGDRAAQVAKLLAFQERLNQTQAENVALRAQVTTKQGDTAMPPGPAQADPVETDRSEWLAGVVKEPAAAKANRTRRKGNAKKKR
jgi:hypothetical protein